jgi:dihydroneopterin aldolase / 2-amino-4-hydroxy-6-hydroxymethyldihydropteridine diphosphokinase / dihydropteroate synthase
MSSTLTPSDRLIIRDLRTSATVGPDRWGLTLSQPITLSVCIAASLVKAGKSDDVADSIDYANLAEAVSKLTDGAKFVSLMALAEAVVALAMGEDERVQSVEVDAYAGNQFLQAEHLGVHLRRTRDGVAEAEARDDRTMIGDLRVDTIIGVNPPQREAKQAVLLNLTFYGFNWSQPDWKETHATLVKVSLSSSKPFKTVQQSLLTHRF